MMCSPEEEPGAEESGMRQESEALVLALTFWACCCHLGEGTQFLHLLPGRLVVTIPMDQM